jgi:hypothetical protein
VGLLSTVFDEDKKSKTMRIGAGLDPAATTQSGSSKSSIRVFNRRELWPTAEFELIPKLPVDDHIDKGTLMFSRLWIDEQNCQVFVDYVSDHVIVFQCGAGFSLRGTLVPPCRSGLKPAAG